MRFKHRQQRRPGSRSNPPDRETTEAARLLLPPGFSTEGPTEAVAISGNMASIDRGMLNERLEAIGRGEFDPVTGDSRRDSGPGFDQFQRSWRSRRPRWTGRPAAAAADRTGAAAAAAARVMVRSSSADAADGRTRTTRRRTTRSAARSLDSAPYQLRPDSPVAKQPYTRQNFGVTVGGPVKIPGVYNGTRRTTFTANYNGNRGGHLFDQYATVPTDAMRRGDFSSPRVSSIDPAHRAAVPRQPDPARSDEPGVARAAAVHPAAESRRHDAQLPLRDDRDSAADNVNLRVTHNFTPPRRARRRGRAGGPGGGPWRTGRTRRARQQQGTTVVMNAQLQYRRNDEQQNVFPELGGRRPARRSRRQSA